MSEEVRTGRARTLTLAAWVVVPVLLLVGVLVVLYSSGSDREKTTGPEEKKQHRENFLATVRTTLARQTDLAACRTVVSQLNAHLQQGGEDEAVKPLPPDKVAELRRQLDLDHGALSELTASGFTPLDAYHLENCFLMRDAARTLELVAPAGRGGKPVKQSPLDRAVLAFAWVDRQVRLAPSSAARDDPRPVPPDFALRRGRGTALERALVFLALLEQLGADEANGSLQGCLLFLPGDGKQGRLWACGVVSAAQPDDLYLFDPRLGIPLPGPGGKGIATLAQARRDPTVLGQLQVDSFRYDVTGEQAAAARAEVFVPLSALAPRMRLLQDRFLRERGQPDQPLPPPVRIRLAEDEPGALASVRRAVVSAGGKADQVLYWRDGVGILRDFIPKEEGGSGKDRRRLHQVAAVPWEFFPAVFRDPVQFNPESGLGQAVRSFFAGPFLRDLNEAGSPRDLLLRGQFLAATRALRREQDQWLHARERQQEATNVAEGFAEWQNKAFAIYAEIERSGGASDPMVRERLNALWRWKPGDAIDVVLNGSLAQARHPAVTYQVALCKHEQAVRLQQRMLLAERAGVRRPDEARKVREAWEQADYWWKQYLADYAKRPAAPAARRLHAEALLQLGDRKGAAEAWRDLSGLTDDLQKLARLWLARQAGATS